MLLSPFTILVIIYILIFSCIPTNAEVFSAIADMEDVFKFEELHIESLKEFVSHQEKIINFMKTKISIFEEIHDGAKSDVSKYLENPVNSFLLTKRLTTDWQDLKEKMGSNIGEDILTNLKTNIDYEKFPTDDDINGAAMAIARLQNTFLIDSSHIADGELNGIKYNTTKMRTSDCYHLAIQLHKSVNFKYAILWFEEALKRMTTDEYDLELEDAIRGYLALAYYDAGNLTEALKITYEHLDKNPHNDVALSNKITLEQEMAKHVEPEKKTVYQIAMDKKIAFDEGQYSKLCRYEVKPSPAQLAPLRCRYVTNDIAFLKYGPLQMEEYNLDPYIVVYHNVMFDSEIEYLKAASRPIFQRAAIKDPVTDKALILNVRTSKSAFLEADNELMRNIDNRVSDMTKLTMTNAEPLQVVNYGIGGHYDSHVDFFENNDKNELFKKNGNRIATILFYMSDVEQGGGTVFPLLDLVVLPKKGTAVVWYNLWKTGRSDYRTRHGACPVLVGSKWVANKWVRVRDQMLRRPCGLEPEGDEELRIFVPELGYVKLNEF